VDIALLVLQTLNGLQLGLLLFLVASGLTLVFGILDFVNLAHGALYMLGAFIFASLTIATGNFLLAILIALPLTGAAGWLVERLVARNLYTRDHLDQVLATFGLILVIDTLVHMFFGPEGMAVPLPDWMEGQIRLSETIILPTYRVLIIVTGLAAAAGLYWLVNGTRLGMLIAPITEASIGMGNSIIITAFVVIIVGGIGSMKGAFIGALLIGLIDTLGRSFLDSIFALFMSTAAAETSAPAVSAMLIYIIIAVVLALRPQGLFPPKVR
jgi:branched-chain amino acid transport system permease protein